MQSSENFALTTGKITDVSEKFTVFVWISYSLCMEAGSSSEAPVAYYQPT
jgi:hypothetical protein